MMQILNDVGAEPPSAVWRAAQYVNIAAGALSGAAGVVAVLTPASIVGRAVPSDSVTSFFVEMYSVRAVVVGAGVIAAGFAMFRSRRTAALVLACGGVIQAADVVSSIRLVSPGVAGASVATAVHLITAAALARTVLGAGTSLPTDVSTSGAEAMG